MKYLLSKVMAFDNDLLGAKQLLAEFSEDDLNQLSNEILAKKHMHEHHKEFMHPANFLKVTFIDAIDAEVNRLLDEKAQGQVEINQYKAVVSRSTSALSLAQFEKALLATDGWVTMLDIGPQHRYWYNSQKLEIVSFLKGQVTTFTSDNKLRFWLQVTETQLHVESQQTVFVQKELSYA